MNRSPESPVASPPSSIAMDDTDAARHFNEAALHALALNIKTWGRELGFGAIGISGTDLSAAEAPLAAWLDAGCHGEMDYMAKHGTKRARPAELVAGTRRVITARIAYLPAATLGGKAGESVVQSGATADANAAVVAAIDADVLAANTRNEAEARDARDWRAHETAR